MGAGGWRLQFSSSIILIGYDLGMRDKQTIAMPKITNGFELLGEMPPAIIIKRQIAIITTSIPLSTSLKL